jgi:hypothetical protein
MILPLGAVIWAAVEKSPGFTPEGLIAEIRRNSNYSTADWRALLSSEPLNPSDNVAVTHGSGRGGSLRRADANRQNGPAFLEADTAIQPDPDRLTDYQIHAGQRQGVWPSSSEITTAMLERCKTPPTP